MDIENLASKMKKYVRLFNQPTKSYKRWNKRYHMLHKEWRKIYRKYGEGVFREVLNRT